VTAARGVNAVPRLEARGLTKHYGHVTALDGANFSVYPNEIVALIGDNGAGKSTLVSCLSGTVRPDAGAIFVNGVEVGFGSPTDARAVGIETVYQDLALASDLTPAANLFLGREVLRRGVLGRLGVVDRGEMRRRTAELMANLGIQLRAGDEPVASLSGGQRQVVAVARAVAWASEVVFMDEPTAALGVAQRERVLDVVRKVREAGRSVVIISHNMPEVRAVADRVEVLRLGRRVARFGREEATLEALVGAMTGALSGEPDAEAGA
jgi:simple sugar transport system ATP-binding protein